MRRLTKWYGSWNPAPGWWLAPAGIVSIGLWLVFLLACAT